MKFIPYAQFMLFTSLQEEEISKRLDENIEQNSRILQAAWTDKKYYGSLIYPCFEIKRIIAIPRKSVVPMIYGKVQKNADEYSIHFKVRVDYISFTIAILSLILFIMMVVALLVSIVLQIIGSTSQYELTGICGIGGFAFFIYLVIMIGFNVELVDVKVFFSDLLLITRLGK